VLEGMFRNPIFCAIWLICFVIQILLVEFGVFNFKTFEMRAGADLECDAINYAVRTVHLTPEHWAVCIFFGIISMPWQWVIIILGRIINPNMTRTDVIRILHKDEAGGGEQHEENGKSGDESGKPTSSGATAGAKGDAA